MIGSAVCCQNSHKSQISIDLSFNKSNKEWCSGAQFTIQQLHVHLPQQNSQSMCIATREIMDCMYEAYMEGTTIEPDDIPQTYEPVWILGKKYNALRGNLLIIPIYLVVYRKFIA